MKKIFLIGMPGSGKTTLGKQLAEKLSLPFVDLDHEIESTERKSIADIFQENGEDYFRKIESDLLKAWATKTDHFVMSTGGGAPCFYDGINVINENGVSIFLNVPVPTLVERTLSRTHRPLLQSDSREDLERRLQYLYQNRRAVYLRAHITLASPDLQTALIALDPRT